MEPKTKERLVVRLLIGGVVPQRKSSLEGSVDMEDGYSERHRRLGLGQSAERGRESSVDRRHIWETIRICRTTRAKISGGLD